MGTRARSRMRSTTSKRGSWRKPIGIVTVSSGGFGGLNCLAQLRLICLAMGGVPIPGRDFPVSRVEEVLDETGGLRDPKLAARIGPFLDELAWYTQAPALGMRGRRQYQVAAEKRRL